MLRFALSLPLLCACALASASPSPPIDAGARDRIDADVRAVLQHTGTPGAAIEVIEDGHIVYRHAYGSRDLERDLPASVDTHFEIGSITKQFTAAAILQLRDAGKLDLDATLSTYLPDAPHAKEVTLRQLLSHTSGLPEYLPGPDDEAAATKPATFDQLLAWIAGKPLDFAPGSQWAYCNTGYLLLGRVIEVVSHETYRHYVRTHLFDRAGLKRTFTVADESGLPDMAIGYRHADGKLQRAPTIDDSVGWSAGNIVSTVDDVGTWSQALADGRIVDPKSYLAMTTPATIKAGPAEYGLGLFVDAIEDQPRIGHTGGSLGFTTADEYFPKQHLRIIAFTNSGDSPEAGETLTTAIFDDLFPEFAASARHAAAGEDHDVTTKTKTLFGQIQSGNEDLALFGAHLAAKMKDGLSKRLAGNFGPFGEPSAFIFKGRRSDDGLKWFDYLIEFGPGSSLKFGVGFDGAGKIASLSFG